jgi:hypothetical protein
MGPLCVPANNAIVIGDFFPRSSVRKATSSFALPNAALSYLNPDYREGRSKDGKLRPPKYIAISRRCCVSLACSNNYSGIIAWNCGQQAVEAAHNSE